MSTSPYFRQRNVQKQEIKMAMKVHSKNAHYLWYNIQKRHWFAHGKYLGLMTIYH
jgi:serine/threonine-protein kinase HipA